MAPNENCRGPSALTGMSDGQVAILDRVNQKILVVPPSGPARDISLPADLAEPIDILSTQRGFVVAAMNGDVAVIGPDGKVLDRVKTAYNPEAGAPKLVLAPSGGLALEDVRGRLTPIDLNAEQRGAFAIPGVATGALYEAPPPAARGADNRRIQLDNSRAPGLLAKIELEGRMPISNARVFWAQEGQGALVSVQENREGPKEASFLRVVRVDKQGKLTGEAYLGPETFACEMNRPFARLSNGDVASMVFKGPNNVVMKVVKFAAPGKATPRSLGPRSEALPALDVKTLTKLEKLNVPSVKASKAALVPIGASEIMERARTALALKWQMKAANFSHAAIPNRCEPRTHIWRRPPRLDNMLNKEVTAIPYRWGGHVSTLETFIDHLSKGRLAGDDCTCRTGNFCIVSKATGLDCSGFVSFAWGTRYFTTTSLGTPAASVPVDWARLAAGDIVNKSGSHVRMIEKAEMTPRGRVFTVLESAANVSCGGVCRRDYSEDELKRQGYVPRRRVNLTS